jgi:hypothetical protein
MRVLFVFALVACSVACATPGPAGPAWPRSSSRDGDGGESLAPRAAARAIAAIVEDDKAGERAPAAVTPGDAAPPAGPASASTAKSAAADEAVPLEEIVIEVDD